jgi:hypothetical protein
LGDETGNSLCERYGVSPGRVLGSEPRELVLILIRGLL